jgi:putative ABC transport system substrate-binding protein
MRRRKFISLLGGAVAVWPLAAHAQQSALPVIGFLRAGQPPKTWLEAFQQGLREQGYVDGQNVVIEFRVGSLDQLPELADELVRLKVDVILASASSAGVAAKRATTSIPIVLAAVYHPVEVGLVSALSRPGGNITGTAVTAAEIAGKRLQLLSELIPSFNRVAMLTHPGHASNAVQLQEVEVAARSFGVQLETVPVRTGEDFISALESLSSVHGLVHADTPLFTTYRARLVEAVAKSRLPAIYPSRGYVEVGGLISYGADLPDLYRRTSAYVAKILKGAKPAELPIEQPTKFELVVNLRTAKALGLTVPPTLLARADEVIE